MNQETPRMRFPWLFLLRWFIGLALIVRCIYGFYYLSTSWDYFAERAIIQPEFSPYRGLLESSLGLATGIAILLKTKFSIPIALAWSIVNLYLAFTIVSVLLGKSQLDLYFFASICQHLGLLVFLFLLWSKKLLR
jgi:hypothetical protein